MRGHGHDFLIAVFTAHNPSEGYGIDTAEHMVSLATQRFRATTPWLADPTSRPGQAGETSVVSC